MTQLNTEQTLRGAEVVEVLRHCRNLIGWYGPDKARDQVLVKLIDLFSGLTVLTWGQAGSSSTRE